MINAEFNREKLTYALAAVNPIQVDSELGFVQIEFVGEKKVIFSSMNHNTSVQFETEAGYKGKGIVKVPGKQFFEYIRQLPNDIVIANIEKPTQLSLTCGPSSARIQLVQDSVFTSLTPAYAGSMVRLKGELISRWISSFKDFISYDDFRFYVNGALLWIDKTNECTALHSVSSDAIRLAQSSIFEDIEITHSEGGEVIVPKRVLEELRRIAASQPDQYFNLKWCSQELSFSAETDNYSLSAKCITGVYPPYKTAFPKSINATIEICVKPFLESLKRSLIFSNTQDRAVSLKFENNIVEISSSSLGQKEANEIIELNSPVKHPFEVLYNGSFLVGILSHLNSSYATFHWESIERPVKITGEPERGLSAFYLLVPTRY